MLVGDVDGFLIVRSSLMFFVSHAVQQPFIRRSSDTQAEVFLHSGIFSILIWIPALRNSQHSSRSLVNTFYPGLKSLIPTSVLLCSNHNNLFAHDLLPRFHPQLELHSIF